MNIPIFYCYFDDSLLGSLDKSEISFILSRMYETDFKMVFIIKLSYCEWSICHTVLYILLEKANEVPIDQL